MKHCDEPYGILRTASRHEGTHSVSSDDSCGCSRKLSILDFRSRRASISPPIPLHRESIPFMTPQTNSLFFHVEEGVPANSIGNDLASPRSCFSFDSIPSSTSGTNTNLPPHFAFDTPKLYTPIAPHLCKKLKKAKAATVKPKRTIIAPPANSNPIILLHPATRSKRLRAPATATSPLTASQPPPLPPPAPNIRKKKWMPSQKTCCSCKKSKCLKLYCECFAAMGHCGPKCKCNDCHNKEDLNELRTMIIEETVSKNPLAFKSKFKKVEEQNIKKLHSRGCNCTKTACVKNYCECYNAGIGCSPLCNCVNCQNSKIEVAIDDVTAYRDKVLRKRKRRNLLYDFYFSRCPKPESSN